METNEKPIRVLHVLGALDMGGAETMIMNLYRNIDRNHIQFDFIIHTDKKCAYTDEILKMGGRIYSIEQFKGINLISYMKMFNSFYKNHPEYQIIHGHMRSTAAIYLLIAKINKRYTIAHSHNISSGSGLKALVKTILQFPIRYIADYFFACSIMAGKWLFGKRIVKSNRFRVLNNAIDIDKFLYSEQIRAKKRKELNIKDNQLVLGNVARFHKQKNHIFLINVFHKVLQKRPNSKLLLVGEGEEKKHIENVVAQLSMQNNVQFLGSRDDVNELMQAFDIFVFPSKYEGLGIVAIEAQCASLEVLCSTKVPREVKITNNIQFIDLIEKTWMYKIVQFDNDFRKVVNVDYLYKSGYDIKETTHYIESFYTNVINNVGGF